MLYFSSYLSCFLFFFFFSPVPLLMLLSSFGFGAAKLDTSWDITTSLCFLHHHRWVGVVIWVQAVRWVFIGSMLLLFNDQRYLTLCVRPASPWFLMVFPQTKSSIFFPSLRYHKKRHGKVSGFVVVGWWLCHCLYGCWKQSSHSLTQRTWAL